MVQHYLTHVFPNGYKAQIVATSRMSAGAKLGHSTPRERRSAAE
jgi:hypothetical protein